MKNFLIAFAILSVIGIVLYMNRKKIAASAQSATNGAVGSGDIGFTGSLNTVFSPQPYNSPIEEMKNTALIATPSLDNPATLTPQGQQTVASLLSNPAVTKETLIASVASGSTPAVVALATGKVTQADIDAIPADSSLGGNYVDTYQNGYLQGMNPSTGQVFDIFGADGNGIIYGAADSGNN
jgi:hypothetical protein